MSARDRLVVTAIDLIRRQGVSGMGLSELLERSGAARRSLYLNFPGGKAELVADATLTAGSMLADGIDSLLSEQGPVGAVRAFVQMWIDNLTNSDFEVGCPIVAAALGRSEAPAAADAGFVIMPPLAAMAYAAVGKHPVAGAITGRRGATTRVPWCSPLFFSTRTAA